MNIQESSLSLRIGSLLSQFCFELDDTLDEEVEDVEVEDIEVEEDDEDDLEDWEAAERPKSEFMALLADLSSTSPHVVVILRIEDQRKNLTRHLIYLHPFIHDQIIQLKDFAVWSALISFCSTVFHLYFTTLYMEMWMISTENKQWKLLSQAQFNHLTRPWYKPF